MENNEKCPLGICDGSGIIVYEDNTYSECQCKKDTHVQNYLEKALIPTMYLNKTFADFDPEHAGQVDILNEVRSYVNTWEDMKKNGIGMSFISRGTRLGKSHLACAVGHALIEKYQKSIEDDIVLFVNLTNWIEKWKSFFARFSKENEEQGLVDLAEKQKEIDALCRLDTRMNSCDLLIMDDVGEVPGSAYVSSKLYSVVEYRTSNGKPMLITSNHYWSDIASKYGDDGVRITDRLRERSEGFIFSFDDPLKKKHVKVKK